MGLLDRLLKKLQRTEKTPEKVGITLKDILFDWFNENNISVETFVKDFLEPCIAVYLTDTRKKIYINDYPDQALEEYFVQHSIFYLAAHNPDNRRFKMLMDYLMNKENQAYSLRNSIGGYLTLKNFKPESYYLWNVLKAGSSILKIYHALYDNRDPNISCFSSLPTEIRSLLRHQHEEVFYMVMDYFNEQEFEDKLYLLTNSIPKGDLSEYNSNAVELVIKEKNTALEFYNAKNSIQFLETLIHDFDNSLFNIQNTETYKNTERKKRRYLSLKQFPEVISFLEKYSSYKDSIVKFYLVQVGLFYLPVELKKLHKDFISRLCIDIRLSNTAFQSIFSSKIKMNQALIYNNLLGPILLNTLAIKNVDNDLVNRFEAKLLIDTIHHVDMIDFQPSFDSIISRRKTIADEILKSLSMAKFNKLYGEVSFNNNWIFLTINSKKQGDFSINHILDRLNILFPSSLKSLAKIIQYVHGQKMCTINIDGTDYDFTNNIITELNEILSIKKTGYRFLPIIIQQREYYQNNNTDQSLFKCSIELINYEQFEVYKKSILDGHSLCNTNLVNNILFYNQEAALIDHTLDTTNQNHFEISFQNDPTWKWFKDDYVDKLESSSKWYKIMDLLIQCKGSSKPNKQWSEDVNDAINGFGQERYFKELGSLVSTSLAESFWFLDKYRTTIKGIIWTCVLNPNSQSLSIIKLIVEAAYTKIPGIGPKSTALGNLGLNAFVLSKSDEAFGIMNIIRNRSKYQRFIKAIDKSIDKYLESSPGDPEELADKSIPDFGFKDGKKTIIIDDKISVEFFIKNRKLTKKWIIDGKLQTSTPNLIKENFKAYEKEVLSEFKRINSVYKQLRDRIKTFWLYDRKWKYSNWLKNVFNHALLNSYLSGMIWSNETSHKTFIFKEGSFFDLDNQLVECQANDIISLWHPVVSSSIKITDWQNYIYTNRIDQSLRQAFREHYPFSVQESETTKSIRFAHHFLTVRKLMAIANAVGWVFTYEHEGASWPRKFIKPLNLTIHLTCDYNRTDYAIPTKELYFTNDNTVNLNTSKGISKIQFSSIPPKTRSEVCRDMDLFIATTSIANDPELSQKTEEQKNYREDFDISYFSDNATAKVRKNVISVIAPSLGLIPCFDKNYLIIEGKLNKYRINLGSGFAQLANSQKHLNLLPDIKPMKKSKKVHTPIQDDETLYIILAKAKYLLEDDKITDPNFIRTITVQGN